MNDFASALSTALHEEAREIAMSADMQQAERQLQESIRSADRRRRAWIAVAAAAAILVVVAGVTLGIKRSPAQPTQPQPPPTESQSTQQLTGPLTFSDISPTMTVQLPRWIVLASPTSQFTQGNWFGQQNGDRGIGLFSVGYMYPLGATKIAQPSYAALVADWKAVQTLGYGTVSDVATTTVGGRPATTMTVWVSKDAPGGFAYCQEATDLRTSADNCQGISPNRLMYVAIVDQGRTNPPTLLWESKSSSAATPDTATPATASEFAAWLATVHFG